MARPRKQATQAAPVAPLESVVEVAPVTPAEQPTATTEPIEIHAVIPDEVIAESAPTMSPDDGCVVVRYFDGSTFTFDLHVAEGVANFVGGVARVTPALAKALREGGYVEEA